MSSLAFIIVGVFLLLGFIIGAVAGWLIARGYTAQESANTVSANAAEVAAARVRVEELLKRISALETDGATGERALEIWRAEVTGLKQVEARLTSELQAERAISAQRAEEAASRFVASEGELTARGDELNGLREELAALRAEKATLTAQLGRERDANADRSSELGRQLRHTEDTVRVRDHELHTLRTEVTTLREEQARLTTELAAERQSAAERFARMRDDYEELEAALAARTGDISRAHVDIARFQQEKAHLIAQLEVAHSAAADKVALLQQAEARLAEAFHSLSAQALRHNAESFLEIASASFGQLQEESSRELDIRNHAIESLVQPLRASLEQVDARIQHVEEDRARAQEALGEQLKTLAVTQQTLHSETAMLAEALRASGPEGRWGEVQLRRVIEMAGMLEHCDFEENRRVTLGNDVLAPSVLVRMPGGRLIVIDATVPVTAYLDAYQTSDERTRRARLRDHSDAVREHLAKLGEREYWDQFESEPEFVFMFLPGESFLSAVMQDDSSLLEFGARRGVIPASPLTLIALLRAVALGWRQDRLAQDAGSIRALSRELYGRMREMTDQWGEVANGLSQTVSAYNRAVAMMEHRVLATTRRLSEHGGATSDEIAQLETVDIAVRSVQAPGMRIGRSTMRILHAPVETTAGEGGTGVSPVAANVP